MRSLTFTGVLLLVSALLAVPALAETASDDAGYSALKVELLLLKEQGALTDHALGELLNQLTTVAEVRRGGSDVTISAEELESKVRGLLESTNMNNGQINSVMPVVLDWLMQIDPSTTTDSGRSRG